jgi:phosphatidylserine/phosphatidylglycerophosphate/cardiolipin synthase-like enzyme
MHDKELTKLIDGDPSDLKLKLKDAMQRISDDGGKIRLLPAQFIHLSPGAPIDNTSVALMFILFLALSGFLTLHEFDAELFSIDFEKVDTVGLAVVITLLFSSFFLPLLAPNILIDSDGLLTFEKNKAVRDFTEGLNEGRAIIAPFPANIDDNPDALTNWLLDIGINFSNQFGIYHQKYSIIKNPSGHIAYCGGIDLNTNRLDDEHHMTGSPYHDTHLRIEGPAVTDVAQTFHERWIHEDDTSGSADVAFAVPDAASLGTPGKQIVQFGRTYFQAADPARALPFATNGDRTILDTIIKAINQAKEYIYIEDQYFTPPDEYKTALLNKVANREIKKLVIVVPDNADQPFGDIEKQGFIEELAVAQSTLLPGESLVPSILHIGFPRRNYHLPDNSVRASSGKCILEADLPKNATSMIDEELVLGKGPRLPGVPFYMAIEGEIIYAYKLKETSPSTAAAEDAKTARQTKRTYYVLRGDKLPDMGSERKEHKKGATVSVLEYKSIYVHSKTMIIDDMFLCQGSANVNQRGHYHDGEANIFSIPENLKNGTCNPISELRIRLWADMLNLPRKMAAGILRDPVAAAELFDRTPQQGNRFVNLVGRPPMMLLGPTAGTGILPMILTGLGTIALLPDLTYDKFYKTVVDPASELKP